MKPKSIIDNEYFELIAVADGVYAAIVIEGSGTIGNAGIVDLGTKTLVFDTSESPTIAASLRLAVIQLTGRPPSYLVNSHAHHDHWLGNQVFKDAVIITAFDTWHQMQAFAEDMREDLQHPEAFQFDLKELEKRLRSEVNLQVQEAIRNSMRRMQQTIDDLPVLEITLPDLLFEGSMQLSGSRRNAHLSAAGAGHTDCDVILQLPGEGIAFIGDLGFFNRQPFMADCHPEVWMSLIEEMMDWDVQTFIPGHGPVGTKKDLALELQYLVMIQELVQKALQAEIPLETLLQQRLPAPFDSWSADGLPKEGNLRFLYPYLSGQNRNG